MTLVEFKDKLQNLCNEGLSNLYLTVDGAEEIEIEYKPAQKAVNIRKAHK